MIDWSKETITEPPPIKKVSIEDLEKLANGEKKLTEFIPKVVSHSIANERCVQQTYKKFLKRKTNKEVRIAILQTNKSIAKVPYHFRMSHFISPDLAQK